MTFTPREMKGCHLGPALGIRNDFSHCHRPQLCARTVFWVENGGVCPYVQPVLSLHTWCQSKLLP